MTILFNEASTTLAAAAAATTSAGPVAEEEEFYSSWSLFLVCILLILSLLTSYYLQIKRIRAVHETFVSIVAGMFVGLIIRLAPGTMIREMLVSCISYGRDGSGLAPVQGTAWTRFCDYSRLRVSCGVTTRT
jgi:phosphatidylserine synthase